MKKAPVYIFIMLFLCTAGLYSAEISDAQDSTKVRKKKEVYLVAIGGLGYGWGGGAWTWGEHIEQYAPTVVLGLELPFTKSHVFGFEVLVHEWFGTQRLDANTDELSNYYSSNYIKIGKTAYTDIGISHVLKWYITKKTSDLRFCVHLGAMFTNFSHFFMGKYLDGNWDVGFALSYPVDDNLTISLNQRFFLAREGGESYFGFMGGRAPNLLTLNLNYKFKL